ncbi:MAG TPA: hypothetical protein VFE50_13500 [Cyclobacteriaceae bacterium]|nr:hypothetical protein [Cyclobacteriaceae bacterium]
MKCGVLLFMFFDVVAWAQVSNNNIENRLTLDINKPLQSSTKGADVQWKCINKALTNKCLVYHNDQWFSFSVDKPGDYYINIASQQCRDSKGIQMIVIEGNPCETTTYRVLDCIPQIRTEDVFVHVPNLKAKTQYLVNVDGFLGDFCSFNIELSDKPKGLPRVSVNLDTLKIDSRLENKVVSMDWTVDDKMATQISHFRIFRQLDKDRANALADINLGRNAYGAVSNSYHFSDTLDSPGDYKYDIYGIRESDQVPLLLSQRKFVVEREPAGKEKEPVVKLLSVRMNFKEDQPFSLRLSNYDGDHLLWSHEGESQGEGELFMIDPQPYVKYGLRKFQLLVLDYNGKAVEEIYFRVEANGNVIKE